MSQLLQTLCTAPLKPSPATLTDWWSATREVRDSFSTPIERAVASGLHADRIAWAFASGYQAALATMFPTLGVHDAAALCATESTGARPRDIQTSLENGRLNGAKQWTTAASFAGAFFVIAKTGTSSDGKPMLKVVRVAPNAPGVTVTPMEDLPFVPEIPHASLRFENVAVAEADVLPGDGYAEYLKPFRTIEDLHVHAALLGYLLGVARRREWPYPQRELLLAHVVTCIGLAKDPWSAPETHLALAGFLSASRMTIEHCKPLFDKLEPEERARWERDQPLLLVAERVRKARLDKAREVLTTRT
jgi:acyl-CoA dehydrogenase